MYLQKPGAILKWYPAFVFGSGTIDCNNRLYQL